MLENYLLGCVIGLAVGLIFCIVVHFTLFKKVRASKIVWFYITMFVIFAFTGFSIFGTQFKNNPEVDTVTPQELMQDLTNTVSDNWKNTNGGFTFNQIQQTQQDSEAPTVEDQIIDLTCYDFGSYIVFSYKDGDVYQNALFYQSNTGLILDGMINMSAFMHVAGSFFWDFNYWYDLDSFKWLNYKDKEPFYAEMQIFEFGFVKTDIYDDLCSISRRSVKFLNRDSPSVPWSPNEGNNYALRQLPLLTGRNITDNFIKFGEVELIGAADVGYNKINSFYNYLYEQIKGQDYDTIKTIDATNCLCLPIPLEEQTNYPISASKKADYADADYYGVYKCDIAIKLTFKKGNNLFGPNVRNEDYIETLKNDPDRAQDVVVEEISPKTAYSSVSLNFIDTASSNLTNIDLITHPVKITFTDENSQTKQVLINSTNKLNGMDILLTKNTNYTYLIESDNLVFETYHGSFRITENSTSLRFNYYYLDNYIIVSVGLHAVGNVDTTQIDLVANPVRIVLSNASHTYQFEFVSNSDLNAYKTTLVELGIYNYTILSNQLIFASDSGTLTITQTDRTMLFNYTLPSQHNTIYIDTGVFYSNLDYSHDCIFIVEGYMDTIINFVGSSNVEVNLYIYDEQARIIYSASDSYVGGDFMLNIDSIRNNLNYGNTYQWGLSFVFDYDSQIIFDSHDYDLQYLSSYWSNNNLMFSVTNVRIY